MDKVKIIIDDGEHRTEWNLSDEGSKKYAENKLIRITFKKDMTHFVSQYFDD